MTDEQQNSEATAERMVTPEWVIAEAAHDVSRGGDAAPQSPMPVMRAESVEADFGSDQWTFRMLGDYEVGAGEYLIVPVQRVDSSTGGDR